jgi:hypothetical protein
LKSETVLRLEAMNVLVEKLGLVDAERFIDFVKRDKFDYTEWQRNLWKGKTIDEINEMAIKFQKEKNKLFK